MMMMMVMTMMMTASDERTCFFCGARLYLSLTHTRTRGDANTRARTRFFSPHTHTHTDAAPDPPSLLHVFVFFQRVRLCAPPLQRAPPSRPRCRVVRHTARLASPHPLFISVLDDCHPAQRRPFQKNPCVCALDQPPPFSPPPFSRSLARSLPLLTLCLSFSLALTFCINK